MRALIDAAVAGEPEPVFAVKRPRRASPPLLPPPAPTPARSSYGPPGLFSDDPERCAWMERQRAQGKRERALAANRAVDASTREPV